MDLDKSGILSAGEIITEVCKIMDIYVPPKAINLDHTLNKSIMRCIILKLYLLETLKNVGEYA